MKFVQYIVVLSLLLASQSAWAGLCGVGRVAEILEGRNDADHFWIKLDFSVPNGQAWPQYGSDGLATVMLPDQYDNNQTYFYKFNNNNVEPDRLKNIRAAAYLALANGNTVKLISRWNKKEACQNLHEIIIVSSIVDDPNN